MKTASKNTKGAKTEVVKKKTAKKKADNSDTLARTRTRNNEAKAKRCTKTVSKRIADTKKRLLEELKLTRGIITTACSRVGISHTTYYKWVAEDEEFRDACKEVEIYQIGLIEEKLLNTIENDRIPRTQLDAVMFYLRTKGKNHGYSERQEITGADGKDLIQKTDLRKLTDEELVIYHSLHEKASVKDDESK